MPDAGEVVQQTSMGLGLSRSLGMSRSLAGVPPSSGTCETERLFRSRNVWDQPKPFSKVGCLPDQNVR